MNDAELVVVLDAFGTNYRKAIEPAVFDVWKSLVMHIDGDIALRATEEVMRSNEFFPTAAAFLKVATVEQGQRTRSLAWQKGPRSNCGICRGEGWWETEPLKKPNLLTGEFSSYEQWKPCQQCLPDEHDRWRLHNRDRDRRDDTPTVDPSGFVDAARDALHREPV